MNNRSTLQLLSGGAGILGLLLIFAGLGYALITHNWDIARWLLIAGLVLVVVFVWFNPETIAGVLTRRGTRYGANAFLKALAGIGIAILLYAIWVLLAPRIGSGFGRFDVTANGQFTLSPLTVRTLQELTTTVKVIGFYGANDTTQQEATNLLKEYSARTDKLQVQFVDPNSDPILAHQYNLTHTGVIVFDNGARHEQAASATEEEFTGALVRLRSSGGAKTIAVLDAPSLADFYGTGTQSQASLAAVKTELTNQNYTFLARPYNVAISPTITLSNVTVLIVPPIDPAHPLSDQAVRSISDYLDRGGHVLLMGDPLAAPLPAPLLKKYGLTEYHDVIQDSNFANLWSPQGGQSAPYNFLVSTYGSTKITTDAAGKATLGQPVLFSAVEAIQPPTSTITGFTISPVLQSSSTASLSKLVTTNGQTQLQPDTTAPPPPYDIILSVEQNVASVTSTLTGTTTPTQTTSGRLVVMGDLDFAADQLTSLNFPNTNVFTNIDNWLAQSEERISVPPRAAATRTLTLSAEEQSLVFYTSVLFLPLLVLLLGGYIWWRRR